MAEEHGTFSLEHMTEAYGRKCREVEKLSEKLDYPHKEIATLLEQITQLKAALTQAKREGWNEALDAAAQLYLDEPSIQYAGPKGNAENIRRLRIGEGE